MMTDDYIHLTEIRKYEFDKLEVVDCFAKHLSIGVGREELVDSVEDSPGDKIVLIQNIRISPSVAVHNVLIGPEDSLEVLPSGVVAVVHGGEDQGEENHHLDRRVWMTRRKGTSKDQGMDKKTQEKEEQEQEKQEQRRRTCSLVAGGLRVSSAR